MASKCVCQSVCNHKSLKIFLKCVSFLLKHIAKNSSIYDSRNEQFYDENVKKETWKKIASGYIQEYMYADGQSIDGDCKTDGCSLKSLQHSVQHLLHCISTCQGENDEITEIHSECKSTDGILPLPHMVTFSNDMTYMLECIVANPSLYDRNNSHFTDDDYKLKIWNEVCGYYYDEPGNVNNTELEGVSDDIKLQFYQKFAERLLQRFAGSLTVNMYTEKLPELGADEPKNEINPNQRITINIGSNENQAQSVSIVFADKQMPVLLQNIEQKQQSQ